ncbi:hypothetical protein IT072_03635 [Leifsonia sp. ZF2019]|uniref:hypothetical protein n=1 Tax=Leifsonia sp. ZF2019 TaxID=2781978 RepID=UPI001CBEDD8D|nr:hypothetical protein [Leifsonia sp. ZF2019]UAJ80150.1 hypothetical protein IT072_03635 [Leifsonia sp. ZF2019]
MASFSQQGRDLHITIEGVDDPFVIRPLPGRRGQELTEYFLRIASQQPLDGIPGAPADMATVLNWAVNGVDADGEWITDGENSRRVFNVLTLTEGEDVLLPAFYWSSVLGIKGVEEYFAAGGGMAGGVKALGSLTMTLGISPLVTSPSSVLATQTPSPAGTTSTSSPTSGSALERLPRWKRSIGQNGRRRRGTA